MFLCHLEKEPVHHCLSVQHNLIQRLLFVFEIVAVIALIDVREQEKRYHPNTNAVRQHE